MRRFALLSLLVPAVATAAPLPDVAKPDFSTSREVVASLDTMISELQAAAEGGPSSWQIGRALVNCQEARRTVAHWPGLGAYDPNGAERLWQECKSTYDAVR